MRKLILIFMTAMLVFGFTACTQEQGSANEEDTQQIQINESENIELNSSLEENIETNVSLEDDSEEFINPGENISIFINGCHDQACKIHCVYYPEECFEWSETNDYCEFNATTKRDCLQWKVDLKIITPRYQSAFLTGAATPGDCKDQQECENYCAEEGNVEECREWAINSGLTNDEINDAKEELQLDCDGIYECQEYCKLVENKKICSQWLLQSEEITQEAYDRIAANNFTTPGNCENTKDCQFYCAQQENIEECRIWKEVADKALGITE